MQFNLQQSSTIVAIYNEAIGDESQQITLQFPGNASGSPPQRITPQRVDSRTLVFQTPGSIYLYITCYYYGVMYLAGFNAEATSKRIETQQT